MAVQYQMNKVAIQELRTQLKVREAALPTLKSKEAALRAVVKKRREILDELKVVLDEKKTEMLTYSRLWAEFPRDGVSLKKIVLKTRRIAGISVPDLGEIDWQIKPVSSFHDPAWFHRGVLDLEQLILMQTLYDVAEKEIEVIDFARRKTTQKVNLYEKVQIPEFSEAIIRIKRFLEDVENLEKSAQKMTKEKLAQEVVYD